MESIKLILNPNDINVVVYHSPCPDGYSAAFIAKYSVNKELVFIGVSPDSELNLEHITGKNIIMVDVVCKNYAEVNKNANKLIILDHHITNKNTLKDIPYAYFNMHKSGVGIAWEYFNGDTEMPLFLKYIQDRDIWTNLYEDSNYFGDYLLSEIDYSDDKFDIFYKLMSGEISVDEYSKNGKLLYDVKMKRIAKIVKSSEPIKIKLSAEKNTNKIMNVLKSVEENGVQYNLLKYTMVTTVKEPVDVSRYNIYIFNNSEFASDLGSYIMENKECDFAVIWSYNHKSNKYIYSLRSKDEKTNVSEVAKMFNGGGHRNAAGFTSDYHPEILFEY